MLSITLPFLAALSWFITPLNEQSRADKPDSLSSLSHVASNLYYTATDWSPHVFPITLECNPTTGNLTRHHIGQGIPLENAKDIEGIAYDSKRHTLWAADEKTATISEFDLKTGHRLSSLDIPPIYKHFRKELGFESLTINAAGTELWLANEEALAVDGPISTPATGSCVRIQRFLRENSAAPWKAAGQFAYITDPIEGLAPTKQCRSGLSDLCVLPDGTLLALERTYGFFPFPALRCRLYAINRSNATDTSAMPSLSNCATFTPASKTRLYSATTGVTMYEGIAIGPQNSDGSYPLFLISDGNMRTCKKILALRLTAR